MKKVAVLIRDPEQQYEGLRTSLGMTLYKTRVSMFVLDHEVAGMDEAYRENMEFFDEMEGRRYSNNRVNVEKHGFQSASLEQIGKMLHGMDLVIPF